MTAQPDLTDHDMLIRIDTTVASMNKKMATICQRLDNGDKEREGMGNRVTVLETETSTLKSSARQDRWIERVGIIIGSIAATVLGTQK